MSRGRDARLGARLRERQVGVAADAGAWRVRAAADAALRAPRGA